MELLEDSSALAVMHPKKEKQGFQGEKGYLIVIFGLERSMWN